MKPGRRPGNDTPVATAFPYQFDGIFWLSRLRRALLLDDAGLGKSMQLILAATSAGAQRLLVTCQAIGRVSWAKELATWDVGARPIHLYPQDGTAIPTGPVAVVVAMSTLSDKSKAAQLKRALNRTGGIDTAFLDEAQDLKNPDSSRTKAVYGGRLDLSGSSILQGVGRIYVSSASLTPLNVSELFPHLKALFPDVLQNLFHGRLPNKTQFRDRFCDLEHTGFGFRIVGNNAHSVPALRAALRPFILRRRKADVLPQLPPILSDILPLETDRDVLAAARALFDSDPDLLDDDTFLGQLARAWDADEHASRRRYLGGVKAKALAPWLAARLTADPELKVLVFAHHTDTMNALARQLEKDGFAYRMIRGATTYDQRVANVDAFQTDPAVRVFIGQNRAANTSITLSAATLVVLAEPDPSPEQNYQAISRAHRLGQTSTVWAYFAHVAANPIDRRAASILRRRAMDTADLFGGDARGAPVMKQAA